MNTNIEISNINKHFFSSKERNNEEDNKKYITKLTNYSFNSINEANISDIIKKIPKYDILYLGYHNKNDLENHNSYDTPRELWGLFGYIINKKAAKKLLEVFPITAQIDSEISRAYPDLKVYALKEDERIISSDTSQTSYRFGTDIQTREGFSSRCKKYFSIDIIIIIGLMILCIYNLVAINKKKLSRSQ
jgi:GR25 family glycosyltransferase involved in LPS biosynthesis